MIKILKSRKRKVANSYNNLNKKTYPNAKSCLKSCNNLFTSHKINNKKNFREIEAKTPRQIISHTYYKDPFFLNEFNLKTQLNILKSMDKELNNNDIETIDANKETLPTLYDFKANTFNYYKKDPLLSDDFYYKSVFKMKPLFKKIRPVVDNKLNMRYAENEEQYKKIIEKEQKILLAQGQKVKNKNISEHINTKMDEIKKRIRFMKGVIDFSYPGFVLTKIKSIDKKLKKENEFKHKLHEYFSPVEFRNLNKNKRNNDRKNYLCKCIEIKNKLNK